MLNRIQIAAVGAAVLLVAGAGNARGIGGPGLQRSEAAPPAMQARMSAMHQAMQAQANPQPGSDGWLFVGGEAGWVRAAQPTAAPIGRATGLAVQPYGEVTADGWKFVGGEAGWVLEPHRYEFQGGRLVYVDNERFPHDTPAAAKPTAQEQARSRSIFGGG
jgi:hypothetical protein